MPRSVATDVLSDIIVHSKYARWWGELGRRETYEEAVARNLNMMQNHVRELAPHAKAVQEGLRSAYRLVHDKKVLPSMRAMQFAGEPILRDHNRLYNCAYMHANDIAFFRELMFLLLGGSGVGYSVQYSHVIMLPAVKYPPGHNRMRYIVQDSVIGWSDAVDALVSAYMLGTPYPDFDFSEIRPEGEILKTSGGKAPGPGPLRRALERIDDIFREVYAGPGNRLAPLNVHDIACHIADAVLSGGIRRSAMIALFSPSDRAMLECKVGDWYLGNPQRARANNSAVLLRNVTTRHEFDSVFSAVQHSGSGDPGFFWTDDLDLGTNPCAEISLNDCQFCNLTTIHVGDVEDQEDLEHRARAAAIIGTVQATFTDFNYLRPKWKAQTKDEALVGVSMTGIASGRLDELDLKAVANEAVITNQLVSEILGIRPAARVTTVKPEGTASLVLGTSSGVHAWHDDYYLRRIRFNRNEAIAQYLVGHFGLVREHDPEDPTPLEVDQFDPNTVVLTVPQKAPDGAITRQSEGALGLLERVRRLRHNWIEPGHDRGANFNNVSTTVNVREDEWDDVRNWMWEHRHTYNGIALLPYDGGTYVQAPFETCDRETYEALLDAYKEIDVTEIDETADYTNLAGEAACAGGACEVTFA